MKKKVFKMKKYLLKAAVIVFLYAPFSSAMAREIINVI